MLAAAVVTKRTAQTVRVSGPAACAHRRRRSTPWLRSNQMPWKRLLIVIVSLNLARRVWTRICRGGGGGAEAGRCWGRRELLNLSVHYLLITNG